MRRIRALAAGCIVAAALFAGSPAGASTPAPAYTSPPGAALGLDREAASVDPTVFVDQAKIPPTTSDAYFTNDPHGSIQWPFPVGVPVGDRFGPRSCAGCTPFHHGTDFNPGNGAEIQIIADGIVREVDNGDGSLGVNVTVDHQINGQLVSSVYAHMQHGSVRVLEGQRVSVGQVVGLVGSTGQSTGPHLHFAILLDGTEYVDSYLWLLQNAN
ncbi:M23 family metallopeptidase [Microbacteriaceae bacterium VKM Ac-2854]|nr:M23 family metallopeptidase [Microbacteriaceae bacterium VKM Ac-2854]